ncbi:hypothetical protein [Methylobacterium sp. CM6257]
MRAAVEAAPRTGLVELSAALWKAFAANAVTEAEAEELSTLIEARKAVGKTEDPQFGAGKGEKFSRFPAHRLQRPPVRSAAIERRRRLAASGPMPPALAARFTTGELAVLRIVADEHRDRGSCSLCLDAIAARAGVSRSLAKGAIRQARRLGMVEVVERRLVGAKSLPNVVTVVDREWLAWIARGKRIGGRNQPTTERKVFEKEKAAGRSAILYRNEEVPGTRRVLPSPHSPRFGRFA